MQKPLSSSHLKLQLMPSYTSAILTNVSVEFGIEHTCKVPVLAALTFLIRYLLFWRISRLYDATLVLVLRFMIKEHIMSGL